MVNRGKRFETIYTQGTSWNIAVDIETGVNYLAHDTVPDCSSISPPGQWGGCGCSAGLLSGMKTFHDISETFYNIGGCIPGPLLLI